MSSNLNKSEIEPKRKVSIFVEEQEPPSNTNAYDNLGFDSDKNRKVYFKKF